MSSKFRVLMLSLFVVLFAASSAFAVLSGDNDTLTVIPDDSITPAETAGFNYYQRVSIDMSAIVDGTLGTVSWEVYPDSASGTMSWLTWTINSYDVIVQGVLPAVSEDTTYTLHVVAFTSKDYEDTDTGTIVHGTVYCDAGGSETIKGSDDDSSEALSGLEITVTPATPSGVTAASIDIMNFSADLVSVDTASADGNINKVTDTYSVTIGFPTTTQDVYESYEGDIMTFVNAQLEYDESDPSVLAANINLPSWLKYEATSQDMDGSVYVKTLRIFYSADKAPEHKTAASVRIMNITLASDPVSIDYDSTTEEEIEGPNYAEKYASLDGGDNGFVIGWDVSFYNPPAIALNKASYDIPVKYGTSVDFGTSQDIVFSYQEPKTVDGITFSPDISADVLVTPSWVTLSASEDEKTGYITLNVKPLTPRIKTYSTDMTVTDSNDKSATATVYINVTMDSMEITPAVSSSISVGLTQTGRLQFTANNFSGKVVSWDLSSSISDGISVVIASSDSTAYNSNVVLGITGNTMGDYSFSLKATDEDGRSADITVNVTVTKAVIPTTWFSVDVASYDIVTVYGTSGDYGSSDITFRYHAPKSITFSPDISADILITPLAVTTSSDHVLYGQAGYITLHVVPVTPFIGTYSTDMIVTDSNDNKQVVTLYLSVTMDSMDISAVSSSDRVSMDVNATVQAYFKAVNFSGKVVSWDLGDIPSGLTVTVASSDSADYNANVVLDITGNTAGDYSFDLTAVDSNSRSADITVYVTVLPAPVPGGSFSIRPRSVPVTVVIGGSSSNVSFDAENIASGDIVSWNVVSSSVPAGVVIVPASGVAYATRGNTRMVYALSATSAASAGRSNVTVRAVTGERTAEATINLTVTSTDEPAGLSVSVSTSAVTLTPGGSAQTVRFTASNNSGDVTWSLSALPTGVTMTNANRASTHNTIAEYSVAADTSAVSGDYTVTATATDAGRKTASAALTIRVRTSSPTPTPGTITVTASPSDLSVRAGNTGTVTLTATGGSGTITWTLGSVSASGISVTPSASQTGTSATYTVAGHTQGSYSFTVTVSDTAGNSGSSTVSVTVSSTPTPPSGDSTITPETQTIIDTYKATGALNQDGTIPSSAMNFTSDNPSAHTLSRTGANRVTKGSSINPVVLSPAFPVDIWKIYINGVLAAWAYSPGVSASAADDFMTFYPAEGSKGVDIIADSTTQATVTFDTTAMASGSNEVVAAFVPDSTQPGQEIGKTTLATIEVSGSSTTSGDVGVGSSSGGCSAGLGAMVSALAAAFFISKKRS